MISQSVVSACRNQKKAIHNCYRALATEISSSHPTEEGLLITRKAHKPRLSTSIILNRSPLITPTPTPFERAYYAYQARLRRALSNPFPTDFYFKQGSILETRFNIEEREREKLAFGPRFQVLDEMEREKIAREKATAAQLGPQEGEEDILVSRVHGADKTGDTKSLDRKGRRNLYLLLKNDQGVWRFPQGGVEKGELLHQAAQRDLYAECGDRMDVWIVSKNPIGHYKPVLPPSPSGKPDREEVTFFFKAHILAGQVHPPKDIKEFAWLTKQEIETRVEKPYWNGLKDILSDH